VSKAHCAIRFRFSTFGMEEGSGGGREVGSATF